MPLAGAQYTQQIDELGNFVSFIDRSCDIHVGTAVSWERHRGRATSGNSARLTAWFIYFDKRTECVIVTHCDLYRVKYV